MTNVVIVKGSNRETMVAQGLHALGINPCQEKVVIKPNLIINRPYPVTTAPKTVESLITYFVGRAKEILIAEGSGMCRGGTMKAFLDLGYLELAERYGIRLVDLNEDEYELMENPEAMRLKEFKVPRTLKNSFLISAAVLKRHSMTKVSLSLKNMMGASIGRKARFHFLGLTKSIVDINRYTKPDLALIDGIESSGRELGGEVTRYEVMIFSEDPVAADAVGAHILGLDPLSVPHIRLAQEVGLGTARLEELEIAEMSALELNK
ncbi:MAG: DUF362 domain-containing protein [Methanophagales archaeon ANME-1-THS]|nr:MAG: DUF362 domain-containing protein [Methanophagales archaeon ANME-1-THS]